MSNRSFIDDECDTKSINKELNISSILDDFGIKDEQQLRDILKAFMKVTEELSHGMLSKLYTDADFLINYFRDREKIHAHWIHEFFAECSHCGGLESNEDAKFFDYCPTCGATMDEEV